ncbi:MAG: hypothetical protein JXD23_10605 [Spirochaetales bacterium]|nr:hypothetical protein [Spirochaetales bacterium]
MRETKNLAAAPGGERNKRRVFIASAVALLLTAGFLFYLAFHFSHPQTELNQETPDGIRPFEKAWLAWLASGAKSPLEIPKDVDGRPLPFPDAVVRYLYSGKTGPVENADAPDDADLPGRFLSWLTPRLRCDQGSLPRANLAWDDVPEVYRRNETSLISSGKADLFGATAASVLLNAPGRPAPDAAFSLKARDLAAALLLRSYRNEGYLLLETLSPVLGGKDPEFDAWMGSATVMRAIDANTGLDKIGFVEKGMALIDKAVRAAPANLACRYVSINTRLSLPEFFSEQQTEAVDQIAFLTESLEKGAAFTFTGKNLEQETVGIDPAYLRSVLVFASARPGLDPKVTGTLRVLIDRVDRFTRMIGGES